MQQEMMFDKFKISWPGFKWLNPCVVAVCHNYTGQKVWEQVSKRT